MSCAAKKGTNKGSKFVAARPNRGEWDATDVDTMVSSAVGNVAVAPAVTVLTNIAGAVAVTREQPHDTPTTGFQVNSGLDAGQRLRSKHLPENLFNPFRRRDSRRPIDALKITQNADLEADSQQSTRELHHSAGGTSAAAEHIKGGIREALDRWALQTSRRESTVLWRHECSRYASSSRIGYHPNHPSSSHPGSRPSSAATIMRPLHTGSLPHQRASSALPVRSTPLGGYGVGICAAHPLKPSIGASEFSGNATRPRSAVPLLGQSRVTEEEMVAPAAHHQARKVSASSRRGGGGDGGDDYDSNRGGSGSGGRIGCGGGSAAARETTTLQNETSSEGVEVYDDIYEDLDDEDDGELDNRISIMESRFFTAGRERPTSAKLGAQIEDNDIEARHGRAPGTRSARLPPRAPRLSSNTTTTAMRRLVSAAAEGTTKETTTVCNSSVPLSAGYARALRVIKTRPTSAPTAGELFAHTGDPMAALQARRIRVALSSARRAKLNVAEGTARVVRGERDMTRQSNGQLARSSVRDITTAVPSWDRHGDGDSRPISNTTTVGDHGDARNAGDTNTNTSRPSSAAFRRWIEARPSAKLVVSAAASARTIGMDDPELLHLQLEMESRRADISETTLARMEDHYTAVSLRNTPRQADASKRARPTSPRKALGTKNLGGAKQGKGFSNSATFGSSCGRSGGSGCTGGADSAGTGGKARGRTTKRGYSPTTPRRGGSRGSSKSSTRLKGKKTGRLGKKSGRKNKSAGAVRRSASRRKKRGGKGMGKKAILTPRKAYSSAEAFMAEHFPRDDSQTCLSLLGMEQLEECYHVSEALARAGVTVPNDALRRALVIPTDRPLEACLAALPLPLEGLREGPYPVPSTFTMTAR